MIEQMTSINGCLTRSVCNWDKGVAVIESLLVPGSATYDAMTQEQRDGLAHVKSLLVHGVEEKDHIPHDLLEQDNQSSWYLKSNFGGFEQKSAKQKVKSVVLANTFIRELTSQHSPPRDSVTSATSHAPYEWKLLPLENRKRLCEMLSWASLSRWNFNVFDLNELTKGKPLLIMGWAILGSPYSQQAMALSCDLKIPTSTDMYGYDFIQHFRIPPKNLCDYLRVIERDYNDKTSYHNSIHAADVLQSLHSLIQMMEKSQGGPDLEVFSILLAAAVHDVGHPGYNNSFQVNARTNLALEYNDISVLESMHAARAFSNMWKQKKQTSVKNLQIAEAEGKQEDGGGGGGGSFDDVNILCKMTPAQQELVRKFTIEAVLHTDMAKHFSMVNSMKAILISPPDDSKPPTNFEPYSEYTWRLLLFMLHLADISNPTKPSPMFVDWTDRCLNEFFTQGDAEAELGLPVSLMCDRKTTSRPESQIGFINFVVLPAFDLLSKFIPRVKDEILPVIGNNLQYWESQKQEH